MAVAQGMKLTNADARVLFLNSAIRKAQWANPAQTPALGTTLSVVLPKAGIARALLVTCSFPITIGTAVCVPSPKAPYNMFVNAHLQDYSGIDRVNSSVYMLGQLHYLKKRMWEPSSSYPFVEAGSTYSAVNTVVTAGTDPYAAADTAVPFGVTAPYSHRTNQGSNPIAAGNYFGFSRWAVPTAISSANLVFSFWIPVAFDLSDPRGALLLNVPNGQVVLQLTFNNALVATTGIDTPYQSATGTCVFNSPSTANVFIYTYYFDPISVPGVPQNEYPGGIPVPYEDLQLVHEVRSLTVPNLFSAGAESIVTLMSGRDYYRVVGSVVDGSSSGPNGTAGSMLTSRISRTRWVYDGNTPTLDELIAGHLARAQFEVGRDLNEGTIYYDFSDRPWDSNSYGALGWAITVTSNYTTTSPAYFEYLTDALYLATMANA
ncbi:MAG: hypothetical protein ACJ8BW_23865 [Ktedonobacteraceae bacterium]